MKGAEIDQMLAEIEVDHQRYSVSSGHKVKMGEAWNYKGERGEWIVSHVILQDDLRKKLGGEVWGLFCLINMDHGSIYTHPTPVMNSGSVDIRELMNCGKYPIESVEFIKEENGTRFYKVVDRSKYVTSLEITK